MESHEPPPATTGVTDVTRLNRRTALQAAVAAGVSALPLAGSAQAAPPIRDLPDRAALERLLLEDPAAQANCEEPPNEDVREGR